MWYEEDYDRVEGTSRRRRNRRRLICECREVRSERDRDRGCGCSDVRGERDRDERDYYY